MTTGGSRYQDISDSSTIFVLFEAVATHNCNTSHSSLSLSWGLDLFSLQLWANQSSNVRANLLLSLTISSSDIDASEVFT